MIMPDPVLVSAVADLWRMPRPGPGNLLAAPRFIALRDLCAERFGGGKETFALSSALHALGMPCHLPKGREDLTLDVAIAAARIRNAVRDAVPAYGEALERGADAITRRNALEFGTQLLSLRTTTAEALERITQSTGPQLEPMRDGVRGQLREIFGNVAAVASDQNVDARQASAALRALSSPNAQTADDALRPSPPVAPAASLALNFDWQRSRDDVEQAQVQN